MTGLSYSTDQYTFGGPQGRRDGQGGQTARVIRAVAQGIADGVLIADQRLPSIRAMALWNTYSIGSSSVLILR